MILVSITANSETMACLAGNAVYILIFSLSLVKLSSGALNRGMPALPPPRTIPSFRPPVVSLVSKPSADGAGILPDIQPTTSAGGTASPSLELAIVASVPKLVGDVVRHRPTCIQNPKENKGPADNVKSLAASHPRKASRLIALIPGKNVHCNKLRQHTSGLDCECKEIGERCAPANSVCAAFAADLATCGCNLGASTRKGARCESTNNKTISARGGSFRIFSPAPVLEVACHTPECSAFAKLNVLMGTPPFTWTVARTFSTQNTLDNSTMGASNITEAVIGLDRDTASLYITSSNESVICQNVTLPTFRPADSVAFWMVPHVQVYTVSAKDADGTSSNQLVLTIFFNNDC